MVGRAVVIALHGAGADENVFPEAYGAGEIVRQAEAHGFVLERTPKTGTLAAEMYARIGQADAVAGLRQLESEALELDPRRFRASEWLTAGLDRVVDEIAERSPDSLLPILFLHTEVHTRYLEEGILGPFLIDATRQRIEGLIQANPVMLFMKGQRGAPQCGFSAQVLQILDSLLPDYAERMARVIDAADELAALVDKLSREQADSILRATQRAVILAAVVHDLRREPEDVSDDIIRNLPEFENVEPGWGIGSGGQ